MALEGWIPELVDHLLKTQPRCDHTNIFVVGCEGCLYKKLLEDQPDPGDCPVMSETECDILALRFRVSARKQEQSTIAPADNDDVPF